MPAIPKRGYPRSFQRAWDDCLNRHSHAALADSAGRNRARHKHIRRAGDSAGGGGICPQSPALGLQDIVRNALSRTHATGGHAASRAQLQCGGIRKSRPCGVLAPHSAWRRRQKLRRPCSAPGGHARRRSEPRLGVPRGARGRPASSGGGEQIAWPRQTRAPRPPSSRCRSPVSGAPPVVDDLLGLEVAAMTPIEAINKLYELQERAREG